MSKISLYRFLFLIYLPILSANYHDHDNGELFKGFLENLLVKVFSGCQPIQNLLVGDVIHGLDGQQKIVVNVYQQLP